jgi:3-deoxy-D-manno-octulosonate 8-phosphate phosphatase (KDO 8-P phosphatase)
MTTGALPYTAEGNTDKTFHVQDGSAIHLWRAMGGMVAVLSGRSAPSVDARARDLGISLVVQGVQNKKVAAYEAICREAGVEDRNTAVIGDDLPDVPLLERCGFGIAVANARPQTKRAARYVTQREGGCGAIAEAIERLLRHNARNAETKTSTLQSVKTQRD